ncbi:MAG: hypothetical protein R3192_01150 [Woeseiaceae bacterium]|nr:hypothetical protein [Woeseiaceae bacterium]
MGKVVPVELWACNYNNRQDSEDLDAVHARFNRWLDERNVNNFAAWVLTPYHYGPDQDFDLLWMGAYTDGNAMGAGTDQWFAEGGDVNEGFEEVLTCDAHIGFASAMYKSPPSNETPGTGIITMMDCKLNEGQRYPDIQAAELKWAEYMTSAGSTAGTFHWFPTFGGGGADFDYKVVNAYASYTELGADWQRVANGGGREASTDIFGDIDDCDDARVYIATTVRAAQLR